MAQEYVLINEKDDGIIALSKTVFETIADISVLDIDECEKIPEGKFSKPIECKISKGRLVVNMDVKVKYGANVKAVCEKLQNQVYDNILQMTNIKCKNIHVNVVGFQID